MVTFASTKQLSSISKASSPKNSTARTTFPPHPVKLGHGDPNTCLILVLPTSMATTKTSDGAPVPNSLNLSLLAAHKLSGTAFIVLVAG
jgi:hypothetical protein